MNVPSVASYPCTEWKLLNNACACDTVSISMSVGPITSAISEFIVPFSLTFTLPIPTSFILLIRGCKPLFTTAVATACVPLVGADIVTVGVKEYPRPLFVILIALILPFSCAVALTVGSPPLFVPGTASPCTVTFGYEL